MTGAASCLDDRASAAAASAADGSLGCATWGDVRRR